MEEQVKYQVTPINLGQTKQIERRLTALLNYGGFFVEGKCNPGHITLEYRRGDSNDEIDNMRRLSATLIELANIIEGNIMVEDIVSDPSTSEWMKAAINSLEGRDPVDSLADVEVLQRLQQQRVSDAVTKF